MKPVRLLLCLALMVCASACGLKRDIEKPGQEKYKKPTPDAQAPDDPDVEFTVPAAKPKPAPSAY